MKKVRAEVIITGRVQGVWFRSTAREVAQSLGLTGWVRNRADGKVQAVFEGDENSVRRAVSWCHHGPSLADVTSVELDWKDATGQYRSFEVVY